MPDPIGGTIDMCIPEAWRQQRAAPGATASRQFSYAEDSKIQMMGYTK